MCKAESRDGPPPPHPPARVGGGGRVLRNCSITFVTLRNFQQPSVQSQICMLGFWIRGVWTLDQYLSPRTPSFPFFTSCLLFLSILFLLFSPLFSLSLLLPPYLFYVFSLFFLFKLPFLSFLLDLFSSSSLVPLVSYPISLLLLFFF
jgi:hypothetical protein